MIGSRRVKEIDVLKALGIICMVAGHDGAPFTKFIYLFHMAVFFIASGYCFKDSSSDTIQAVFKTIARKLKTLWLPFFLWNTIFTLLNNVFLRINVYTDNEQIFRYVDDPLTTIHPYMSLTEMMKNILRGAAFIDCATMCSAFWFLRILFTVSVCYCIGNFLAKKVFKKNVLLVQGIASAVLLVFGFWCNANRYFFYTLTQTASYYCLYFIGHVLFLLKDKYIRLKWPAYFVAFAVSFGVLLCLNQIGSVGLNTTTYVNPLFLVMASVAGWCFLYCIAYFINRTCLSELFAQLGQRTLPIVILHFLSFKIVALFVCAVYALPLFCVAAFPALYGDRGLWWVAYTAVGVSVPVLLSWLYNNTKVCVHQRLKMCYSQK